MNYTVYDEETLEDGSKITILVPEKSASRRTEADFDRFLAELIIRDRQRSKSNQHKKETPS